MKRYHPILFFLLLFSCASNKSKETYPVPKNKDINDIVEAIICQRNLPVLINREVIDTIYNENNNKRILHRKSVPLCIDLEKIRVVPLIDTSINAVPLPPNTLSIHSLLSIKLRGNNFFSKSDSSYFIFLNDTLKNFRLTKISGNLLVTTNAKEKTQNKFKGSIYYTITIPIFSKDNKKAYAEVSFNCFLCGRGTGVYLKKINNKWKVVKVQELWIS